MSAPVDEIDVGHDPRGRAPWHAWSPRRRRVVAIVVAVLVVASGVLWLLLRPAATPPPAAAPVQALTGAPGADVVQDLPADVSKCPTGAQCTYGAQVSTADEDAFRASFGSAGFIGRQTVSDAVTGEVYWQLIRFTTGTLVTVTLSQQPVSQLASTPAVDDVPKDLDRRNGGFTLTALRDGYLMTASAAGLPGQVLPVRAAQQWVRTVPAP